MSIGKPLVAKRRYCQCENVKFNKTRVIICVAFSYPEPFLRAVNGARRWAPAKYLGQIHNRIPLKHGKKTTSGIRTIANHMPVRIWIWPEPLVALGCKESDAVQFGSYKKLLLI